MNFFNDAYSGNIKLWKVFVFCYLVPLVTTTILLGVAGDLARKGQSDVLSYCIVVLITLFYFFNAVVMWKNAKNTDFGIARILARIFSVLFGIVGGGLALGLVRG